MELHASLPGVSPWRALSRGHGHVYAPHGLVNFFTQLKSLNQDLMIDAQYT